MEDIFELTKSAHEITEQTCGHIKGGLISADDAQKKIKDAWNLVFARIELYEKANDRMVVLPTESRILEKAAEFHLQFKDVPCANTEVGFSSGAKWMKESLIPKQEEQEEDEQC